MSIFGIQQKALPKDITSKHFSNNQLQILYKEFGFSNKFDNPNEFGNFIEKIYEYNTFDEFKIIPFAQETGRDGLWKLWCLAWIMRSEKDGTDREIVEKYKVSNPEYFR